MNFSFNSSADFTKQCKDAGEGSYVFKNEGVFGIYRRERLMIKQEDALQLIMNEQSEFFNAAPKSLPSETQGSYCFVVSKDRLNTKSDVLKDFLHPWDSQTRKSTWTLTTHENGKVRFGKSKHSTNDKFRRVICYIADKKNHPISNVFYQYIIVDHEDARMNPGKFSLNIQSILEGMATLDQPAGNNGPAAAPEVTSPQAVSSMTSPFDGMTSPSQGMTSPAVAMTSPVLEMTSPVPSMTSLPLNQWNPINIMNALALAHQMTSLSPAPSSEMTSSPSGTMSNRRKRKAINNTVPFNNRQISSIYRQETRSTANPTVPLVDSSYLQQVSSNATVSQTLSMDADCSALNSAFNSFEKTLFEMKMKQFLSMNSEELEILNPAVIEMTKFSEEMRWKTKRNVAKGRNELEKILARKEAGFYEDFVQSQPIQMEDPALKRIKLEPL